MVLVGFFCNEYRVVDADAGDEHTVFILVNESSFSPKLYDNMLSSDYMKTVRVETMMAASMNPYNIDVKF